MNLRPLGKSGLRVSEISFGCVELGLPYGIKEPGERAVPAVDEAVALVRAAIDCGINFFDTARSYGNSESILGQAFAGRREQVLIATKCRMLKTEDPNLAQPSPPLAKGGPEGVRAFIEQSLTESLTQLRTDYVDAYLLHEGRIWTPLHDEAVEVLRDLKQRGLTRTIGLSAYGPDLFERALDAGWCDLFQFAYHLLDLSLGQRLFPRTAAAGVGVVVRSVLFKGILTEKARYLHEKLQWVYEYTRKFESLLSPKAPTLSTLAIKFALSRPEVSSVVLGLDRADYLDAALRVADGDYLTPEEQAAAAQLAYPCPEELDLPAWDRAGWLP
jgi:aryl-alcohol dehydrogenase-like predicted oxidoreductase